MLLEVREASKTYQGKNGAVRALDHFSISLEAGQFFAVQGPSGCGKTTLLLIAGGLLSPDDGEVFVNGQNLYELSPDSRARFRGDNIGFVFQQFHLIPYLNVLDNVMAPAIATDLADADQRARELIEHFGLAHRTHHVPGQLSSGERQRTALARACLNRPKILLADEPTGNLDRDNASAVLRYLGGFSESGGAVLLVTHDSSAAEFSGRVITMREGNLAG